MQFQVGDELIYVVDSKDPKRVLEGDPLLSFAQGVHHSGAVRRHRSQHGDREHKAAHRGRQHRHQERDNQQFVQDGASSSPSIEDAIKKFFRGSMYKIDMEHNLIVATGTREQLALLERIIEEFDRPVQQVLIEARFITISQAAFMQLGASWETGRTPLTASPIPTDFTGLATTQAGLGLQTTFTNVLNRYDLSVTLKALEQGGESQTLSAPRLTLVNNLPAHIEDGQVQYYYEQYTV